MTRVNLPIPFADLCDQAHRYALCLLLPHRRDELLHLYVQLQKRIQELDRQADHCIGYRRVLRRRVYEELLGSAERSIWVSTYAFFDGPKAFQVSARRMD
jgi:hypothetical protein